MPPSNSAVSPLLATSAATATNGVIKGAPSMYVKLNVGGSLFNTTIGTLTKHDTMLRAMFSGRMEVLTDSEGWIMIDRSGKHFGSILNFLRDGNVFLPGKSIRLVSCEALITGYGRLRCLVICPVSGQFK